jgi:protein TonB
MRVILIYNPLHVYPYPFFPMSSAALSGTFGGGHAMRNGPVTPRISPTALGVVVLAHVAALFALQSMGLIEIPIPPVPLMVELIENKVEPPKAPVLKPPKPVITPKPKPAAAPTPVPRQETPVLATESPTPAPSFEVAKVEKVEKPAPVAPVKAVAATPVPPSSPVFDADYLHNPSPVYPPLSVNAREEGKVLLSVHVEANGQPSSVEVLKSSGFDRLDKSAVNAVRRWKFTPAKLAGEAVAAWVNVPVNFSLKEYFK